MLKIGGLQTDIRWESPKENFTSFELAVKNHAYDLIVFPEMSTTGFSMNASAVTVAAPEIENFFSQLAIRNQTTIIGGYGKAGPSKARNLAGAWDSSGKLVACYQKIQTFTLGGETLNYESGNALTTLTVKGVRTSLFICYDLRFPELFRAIADASDLIVVIANWPASRITAWTTLLRARAIENQCYVLGVNRIGTGDGLHYSGNSLLIDPVGEVLSSLPEHQSGWIEGVIDPALVRSTREKFPFLKDRRKELYRTLLGS